MTVQIPEPIPSEVREPDIATWQVTPGLAVRVDGRKETFSFYGITLNVNAARELVAALEHGDRWLERYVRQQQDLDAEVPF